MARSRPEFAEFVATLSADDKELLTDLKSAEIATKASATKMQANLSKVAVGGNAGAQALGTMGQAAAAMGGQLGGATGQGIAFTQMLGQMGIKMGLVVTSVVAAAAAVVIYRKEIAGAIIATAEWAGVIEDVTAKQAGLDVMAKDLADRLKISQARGAIAGAAALAEERLGVARAGGAAAIAAFDRQAQIDKQFRALPGDLQIPSNRKIIEDTVSARQKLLGVLTDEARQKAELIALDLKAAQMATEQAASRERALEAFARKQETLFGARRGAAQQLLVSMGAAVPSDFVADPVLRELAQIGERLNRPGATGTTGTFGLLPTPSPLSAVRGGEVLGRQQLTAADKTAKSTEDQLREIRLVRGILERIEAKTGIGASGGSPLQITGRP